MAGIAGIAAKGAEKKVSEMLERIRHRGSSNIAVFENENTTLGMVWNDFEDFNARKHISSGSVGDEDGPGHYARVKAVNGRFIMSRDELGVAPLYYGSDQNGNICFASEIKSLITIIGKITELTPGTTSDGSVITKHFELKIAEESTETPDNLAARLYDLLFHAVGEYIKSDIAGSWLSGGLDSSTLCALAARHTNKLKTFSAGIKDAPDLKFAREMASYLRSEHYEMVVTVEDLVKALPEVIFHLESFDALLVRSSITNYLVARLASDHVYEVFSGEGGDELFAGYDYLKSIPQEHLQDELISITGSLHNTALQRVDRSASAHGTKAHTVFTRPEIVSFAFSVPVNYKIYNNIEKWILRKSMENLLPESVLNRPKAKFWEGAGIKELISDYAGRQITDHDFRSERRLPNGLVINTVEELFYYRIFREHFGINLDLSWMGRTKGSPVI